jgi:hypothetical protein
MNKFLFAFHSHKTDARANHTRFWITTRSLSFSAVLVSLTARCYALIFTVVCLFAEGDGGDFCRLLETSCWASCWSTAGHGRQTWFPGGGVSQCTRGSRQLGGRCCRSSSRGDRAGSRRAPATAKRQRDAWVGQHDDAVPTGPPRSVPLRGGHACGGAGVDCCRKGKTAFCRGCAADPAKSGPHRASSVLRPTDKTTTKACTPTPETNNCYGSTRGGRPHFTSLCGASRCGTISTDSGHVSCSGSCCRLSSSAHRTATPTNWRNWHNGATHAQLTSRSRDAAIAGV